MRILLVNPPNSNPYGEWDLKDLKSSSPPLGLLSIASYEREKGHKVSVLDLAVETESEYYHLRKRIIEFKPTVIFFTAMTMQIRKAYRLCLEVKEHYPKIKCYLGGPHATSQYEECKKSYPEFDKIHKGELEKYDFLDELPFPAFDLVDLSKYRLSAMGTKKSKSIGLLSSRGCPGQCAFCDRSVFGNQVRFHSPEYMVDLMRHLNKKYGFDDFLFYDDLFVIPKKRILKFCEMIKPYKFTWSCCSRVDTLDKETLLAMKRAGCWLIEYGIESGCETILKLMKKNITLEDVERTINLTNEVGIKSKGNFIFGFIGETKQTLKQTIKFINKLKLDYFQHTFFAPLPGSEVYEYASRYGSFNKEPEFVNTFKIGFIPEGMTKGQLLNASKKAFLSFYLRPRIIFRELFDLKRLPLKVKGFLKTICR